MTLYQTNDEVLCRNCILEEDPTARFEDDDRWSWSPRYPETSNEDMRDIDGDPYDLDPTTDFEGEYYPLYRGPVSTCESECCLSELHAEATIAQLRQMAALAAEESEKE